MAGFLFKLETLEGEPAEPSEMSSAVPNWARTASRALPTVQLVARPRLTSRKSPA
jgi:hypothetical protein